MRLSQALQHYNEAVQDLQHALELEPGNKGFAHELGAIRKDWAELKKERAVLKQLNGHSSVNRESIAEPPAASSESLPKAGSLLAPSVSSCPESSKATSDADKASAESSPASDKTAAQARAGLHAGSSLSQMQKLVTSLQSTGRCCICCCVFSAKPELLTFLGF